MLLSMFEKTSISSFLEVKKHSNPPNLKFDNFPFGINLKPFSAPNYFDFFNGPQIFEIFTYKMTLENGFPI